MHIFLPENFSPEIDIIGYNPNYHEKYLWFIHTLIDESCKNEEEFNGYVNLQSKVIGKFLGEKDYTTVITTLIESQIVERNDKYSAGRFSKSYRLGEKFLHQRVVTVSFDSGRTKSYWKKQSEIQTKNWRSYSDNTVYHSLLQDLQNVQFDAIGALEFLGIMQDTLTVEQYNSRLTSIQKLQSRNFFFEVSSQTGRVYNNITSLPKEFRNYLSFTNESLVQLDIRNSQPLLFCLLLQPNTKVPRLKFFESLWDYFKTVKTESAVENSYPEDVELYRELTQRGVFYDEFINYLNERGVTGVPSREEFKREFFKRIFFSTGKVNYRYMQWFREWMPTVMNVISSYKMGSMSIITNDGIIESDDGTVEIELQENAHSNLAIKLQQVESKTMLLEVCATIMKEISPAPFFLTVHDAILCEERHADIINEIITRIFLSKHNLRPTIKQEKLDKPTQYNNNT